MLIPSLGVTNPILRISLFLGFRFFPLFGNERSTVMGYVSKNPQQKNGDFTGDPP
jgi:hypothetical protein